MSYQEGRYWERRYRDGGSSGAGLPAERKFLVDRVTAAVAEYQVQSILDVGVGSGELACLILAAAPEDLRYTGLDISRSGVQLARRKVPASMRLEVADVVAAPFPPRDMVLCFNVHYHVATDERAAMLVRNVLTSASKVVLFLTWNEVILDRGPLAPHCHYRPLQVAPDSGFTVAEATSLPGSPHKTLYTLARAREPR